MAKTVLITGSTDGIGLETAKMLAAQGHTVLLHGRNAAKLNNVEQELSAKPDGGQVEGYVADLSTMADVTALAEMVTRNQPKLDVLINNAGILKTPDPITQDGLDVRFVVNTIAPYLLTERLMPRLGESARVINVSSAAQTPVNPDALSGQIQVDDMAAYAQSKLAITMWSRLMAQTLKSGPSIIAVNPGSLLASKMVQDGFGVAGNDIRIGADILTRAAVADEFAAASGQYFDNDSGQFAQPHPDALDDRKCEEIVRLIKTILAKLAPPPTE